VPASKSSAGGGFAPPGYPYVGPAPSLARARAAQAPSLSVQGGSGLYGYSLTFTPASATRLNVSGTVCLGAGSVCANGPATGVDAEINVSGYVEMNGTSGGITVNGGAITNSDFQIQGLATHLHFTYTVLLVLC